MLGWILIVAGVIVLLSVNISGWYHKVGRPKLYLRLAGTITGLYFVYLGIFRDDSLYGFGPPFLLGCISADAPALPGGPGAALSACALGGGAAVVEAAPAVFLGIAIHEAVTLYSTNGELVDAYKDVQAKCN